VKEDAKVTRKQKNIIFYGSTEERRKQQREMKHRRWRHHSDNITAAKLCDGDLRPLPDCRDLFLRDSLANDKAQQSSHESSDMCDDITVTAAASDDDEIVDDAGDVPDIELDVV